MSTSRRSRRPATSNILLAVSTAIAALFVAVQAWYARVAFVETSATRHLEKKLDICFENFDAAVDVDGAIRLATPTEIDEKSWPPAVMFTDSAQIIEFKRDVVPSLNRLESGLTKATILGPLDRYREYLAQQISGLSERLMKIDTDISSGDDTEIVAVLDNLSEFLGAQYSVLAGCRLVAEGDT